MSTRQSWWQVDISRFHVDVDLGSEVVSLCVVRSEIWTFFYEPHVAGSSLLGVWIAPGVLGYWEMSSGICCRFQLSWLDSEYMRASVQSAEFFAEFQSYFS